MAVHADKGQQEGSVPLAGILILLVVLAAIAGVWINGESEAPHSHSKTMD